MRMSRRCFAGLKEVQDLCSKQWQLEQNISRELAEFDHMTLVFPFTLFFMLQDGRLATVTSGVGGELIAWEDLACMGGLLKCVHA